MKDSKNLSVSQLNGYIKSVFDDELILHNICVYGELSQLSVHENSTYFTLTEGNCYINCVCFSVLEKHKIGTRLRAYGRVSYYSKTGKINFTVRSVLPIGEGELHAEFLKLKQSMANEGLFAGRQQPPNYIKNVGVITSGAGAVIHDIMSVFRDKKVNVDVKLFPVSVQGENAEKDIIEALKKANSSPADVIILARGGGSKYDLDVFNSEKLARAVANSDVAIISAIGHETDYTLCDFCAGRRAGTPSIAADMIADINLKFLSRFFYTKKRMDNAVDKIFSRLSSKLFSKAMKVAYALDKRVQISDYKTHTAARRLDSGLDMLIRANAETVKEDIITISNMVTRLLDNYENRLSIAIKALDAFGPLKILSKGYAKIRKNGREISSVTEFSCGEKVQLLLHDGYAEAELTDIKYRG